MIPTTWFDLDATLASGDCERLKDWEEEWQVHREMESDLFPDRREAAERALRLLAAAPAASAEALTQVKVGKRFASLLRAASILPFPALGAKQPKEPSKQLKEVPFEPGDIIALPAQPALCRLSATHVFIVADAPSAVGQSSKIVIPFSPLSVPATDGEWATPWGETEPSLSVLCVWNNFAMADAVLKEGRLSLKATGKETEKVRDLWLCFQLEGSLLHADRADQTVGPALVAPNDPRQDYLEYCVNETAAWKGMTRCPQAWERRRKMAMTTAALVSSVNAEHSATITLRMQHHEEKLRMTLNAGQVACDIIDARGERRPEWDGAMLVTARGWATAFKEGAALAPLGHLRPGFALLDPTHTIVFLEDEQVPSGGRDH
jgi:hypothetical protein